MFFLSSCSTKKNIIYLQDYEKINSSTFEYDEYKVKIDDILKIDINFISALTTNSTDGFLNNDSASNKETMLYEGFQVNLNGDITYPFIGLISVEGKSINEVKNIIHQKISETEVFSDSFTIDVKVINNYFTCLGEFNNPGRHEYLENNINIFEAIGIAGDLTINGKRNNVKIIREENNQKRKIYSVDLTNSKILSSDAFQILSGDIIIVEPNTNRIKNAGIIGNSGTLLSLLSFILSSIIVINSN